MSDLRPGRPGRTQNTHPTLPGLACNPDTGKTDQSQAAACDINNIMSQYERTGAISHQAAHAGQYGDFSQTNDFQTSQIQLIQAQQAFDAMPANIRKRMGNDPQTFLDFMENPDNLDESIELGLREPKKAKREPGPPAPKKEPVTEPAEAPTS